MTESTNRSLIRHPGSSLEKIEPGAERILSDMVADALAQARSRPPGRSVFRVAICGLHGGLDEYLTDYLRKVLAGEPEIQVSHFINSDDLLAMVGREAFDVLFLFVNPDLPAKDAAVDVRQLIGALKSGFQRPLVVISNEMVYGRQTASMFLEAGANAFFPMPFNFEYLGLALVACGVKLKD